MGEGKVDFNKLDLSGPVGGPPRDMSIFPPEGYDPDAPVQTVEVLGQPDLPIETARIPKEKPQRKIFLKDGVLVVAPNMTISKLDQRCLGYANTLIVSNLQNGFSQKDFLRVSGATDWAWGQFKARMFLHGLLIITRKIQRGPEIYKLNLPES